MYPKSIITDTTCYEKKILIMFTQKFLCSEKSDLFPRKFLNEYKCSIFFHIFIIQVQLVK